MYNELTVIILFKFEVMTIPRYFTLLLQVTGTDQMLYVKDTGERLLVIFKTSHLVGLSASCHMKDQL